MADHAKLSPSAAKRWSTCPASVEACARTVSPDTGASLAGTAGHSLHDSWLTTGQPWAPGTKAPNGIVITQNTIDDVGMSVGWIRAYLDANPGSVLWTEEKVQIGAPFFGLDPSVLWGTSDTVILAKREIVVHDLKLGYVAVEAEENPQLLLYALGVCESFGWLWEDVRLVIAQPKNGGMKEWTLTARDLRAWGESMKPKVAAALLPDAPFVPSEEGCRYCNAAGVCKALQANALAIAQREFDTPDALVANIGPEELSILLQKADLIDVALKAAREHAKKLLSMGIDVPGFKLVEGRKNRAWRPGVEEDVIAKLRAKGLNEEQFAPRNLVSFTTVEKLAGKDFVAPFVEKPKGEAVLAPASDKRPALPPAFESVDVSMGGLLE